MLRFAIIVVAVLGGRAAADGAVTLELSAGPGYLFDSPTTLPLADMRTRIAHQRTATLAAAFGIGGFVAPWIALLARASCAVQGGVCFAGPSVQVWPHEQLWLGGGFGLGSDPNCLGSQKTCGVDTCSCDSASDAFELRGGVSLHALQGGSLQLEYVQFGAFSAKGSVNTLSVQFGYQWH